MKTVRCLLPDGKTTIIVDVSDTCTGSASLHLKRMIKEEAPNTFAAYDAHELILRLAKRKKDDDWLNEQDAEFRQLVRELMAHGTILDERSALNEFGFPELGSLDDDGIHVIVEVPSEPSVSLSCFQITLSKRSITKFAEWVFLYALAFTALAIIFGYHPLIAAISGQGDHEVTEPLLFYLHVEVAGCVHKSARSTLDYIKAMEKKKARRVPTKQPAEHANQAEGELNP